MIRLAVQRSLERGNKPNLATSILARAWGSHATVTRALVTNAPTLCISGATLGGSGRTPLAIACARFLSRAGLRVALVGHGYRATPPRAPRRVHLDDDVRIVGDEAIACARALASDDVAVVVARSRQAAITFAERHADALVLDGPLQLEPRATLSLLAVDALAPWGSGACPPLGNLRAPKTTLLAASDAVVPIAPVSRGVHLRGELVPFHALREKRLGLATGIARPERVVALLRANDITPACEVYAADHERLCWNDRADIDLWLTTSKDAARESPGDHGVIDYHLDLPKEVAALLHSRFSHRF